MAKDFEELFKECQFNMIRACMEYADFREDVEAVYIYASRDEPNGTSCWFYKIGGRIVWSYGRNDTLPNGEKPFDSSFGRFRKYSKIVSDGIDNIQNICKENGEKMPTEMKIVYDTKRRTLSTDYNYDPLIPYYPNLPWDGGSRWRAEVTAAVEQGTEKSPDDYDESVGLYGGTIMRNIEVYPMEKYNGEDYEKTVFNINYNKKSHCYHFAFSAEFNTEDQEENWNLLGALAEDYGLSFGENIGQEQVINSVKKTVAEVYTLTDTVGELVKILNFSTIVGNTVGMVDCFGYVYLVKCYGMGKATYNGVPFDVPLYGYRSDFDGKYNYEVLYPELQVKSKFEKGFTIRGPKNNAHLRFVIIKDRYFYVVMSVEGKEKALKFSLQGFEKVVDDID